MKKLILGFLFSCSPILLFSQTHLRIWQGGESNRIKIANAEEMTMLNGTITIKDTQYSTTSIDSIVVVPEIVVTYSGSTATVSVPEAIASDVTVSQSGADVVITNTNKANEVEYVLQGTSSEGSFTLNASYKTTITLNGLTLSSSACPINLQCGKRISLVVADGTVNTITDGASNSQMGAIYAKGHVEIEGSGYLYVYAQAKHGICAQEYLQLKKSTGTIAILNAASDGMHVGQYFQMNGGTVYMTSSTAGDGIQVEATSDESDELNGQFIMKGGTIEISVAQEDTKAIKADADVTITGGTISLIAAGNGSRGIQTDGDVSVSDTDDETTITIAAQGNKCTQAACEDDPHKCFGIKAANVVFYGGTTTITNTGKYSKAIKASGSVTTPGGTLNADASAISQGGSK